MANQFVQENNQIMLWKIVNNTSQLVEFFAPMKPGFKEEWFKSIIHQVYGETQGRNVSLRDINKRALDCMLESIRKMSAEKRPTTFTQGSTSFTQGHTALTQATSLAPSQKRSMNTKISETPILCLHLIYKTLQYVFKSPTPSTFH